MQLQRTAVFLACKSIRVKIVPDVMMQFYHLQILAVHVCVSVVGASNVKLEDYMAIQL